MLQVQNVILGRCCMQMIICMQLVSMLTACGDDSPLKVDEYDDIPKFLEHQKIPGISIAIINNFQVEKVIVYGVKEVGLDKAVSKDTLFQAGAISQSVTALAAMKTYQDRTLDPDSNINDQLTSWELDAGVHASRHKATLRKLLSHTAGTNVTGYAGYPQGQTLPTLSQILNNTGPSQPAGVIINSDPGAYRYSSGGYSVVQQALIDVSGVPFETLMSNVVFDPLRMTNSSFKQPLNNEMHKLASTGHDTEGAPIPGRHHNYPEMAASGLWTTSEDIAKFVIELQTALQGRSRTGLNKETAWQLLQPAYGSHGLGVDIVARGDSVYFGGAGTSKGYQASFQAHQTLGLGVVIMTNSENGFQAITKVLNLVAKEENWPDY